MDTPLPEPDDSTTPDEDGETPDLPPEDLESSLYWIEQVQEGRADTAWGKLAARYEPGLLAYAEQELGDHLRAGLSASDLVQEAMGRAFRKIAGFQRFRKGAFGHHLRREIWRIAREKGRKGGKNRRPIIPIEQAAADGQLEMAGEGPSPASIAAITERIQMIHAALYDRRMPELYRQVVLALLFEERDRKEVARERGVSEDTLRRQFNRGRQKLRDIIGAGPDDLS